MDKTANPAVLAQLRLVGGRIRDARTLRRWPQGELAQRAGLSRDTIFRLEAGRPVTTEALFAVFDALGQLDGVDHLMDARADALSASLLAQRIPRRARSSKDRL
jgi:transcriptional regulator with XRE-family HTH domain